MRFPLLRSVCQEDTKAGPAWMPRLCGAVTRSQNRMLRGPQAFELGMADAMFEPADFLEESLRWAALVLNGEIAVQRAPVPENSAADWDAAVAAARFVTDGKLHGAAPAPYRALDLVAAAKDRTRDEGFAAEDKALADLIMSDELRAGLYAFDLTQKRAKRPVGGPGKALARPVTKAGVVGAGLMAAQVGRLFARELGVPVCWPTWTRRASIPVWTTCAPRSANCWTRSGSPPTRRTGASSGSSPVR